MNAMNQKPLQIENCKFQISNFSRIRLFNNQFEICNFQFEIVFSNDPEAF